MATTSKLWATFALLTSTAACRAPDEGRAEPAGDVSDLAPPTASFVETGVWEGESSDGTSVLVTTPDIPVTTGPLNLQIKVGEPASKPLPLTVDLVSPEMPMHGIQRYTAAAVGPSEYSVATEIPMDGKWLIYVNLDVGVNTVSFELDVPIAPGGGGHSHDGEPQMAETTPDSDPAPRRHTH